MTISDAFAEQQSNVIDWNGITVYGLLEFATPPSTVTLTFVSAKADPVQGIQLRARRGTLVVNGRESADVVLWQDTAPRQVTVEVKPSGRGTPQLKLWNVWRAGLDVTQAWLGNAAIRIEGDQASGAFTVLCSDGLGDPDFADLVVDVNST